MNRTYRVIWSRARQAWVVASELAASRRKGSARGGPGGALAPLSGLAAAPRRGLLQAGILAVLAASVVPAHAQEDRYWDANGSDVGAGGTGNWDTGSAFWSESNSDVLGPYRVWDNLALDDAIFGGMAGTVTLTSPITAHDLLFNTTGYVLDGGVLTLAGAMPTIDTGNGTQTINSVVAGTAGLTKAGTGTLFLTGTNTFSGGITLNAGTLRVDDDAALGVLGNVVNVTANAGFLIDSGDASNRSVTVGADATLTLSGGGTGTALYSGDGNLLVRSGTTMSNDANTYTGTTRLSGASQGSGNVFFTSVRNLGEASSLGAPTTVESGTITFSGGTQYSDRITYIGSGDSSNRNWIMSGSTLRRLINQGSGVLELTGDIEINGSAAFQAVSEGFSLLGVISGATGTVSFAASAAGSITLAGANTFSGISAVGGGVVSASKLSDAGVASSFGIGSQINLNNAAVLRYTGTGDSSNRAWISDGATEIQNEGSGALTLSGDLEFTVAGAADSLTFGGSHAGTNVFSGVISGAGDLASSGSSTWELSGANTRTGAIVIDAGTLRAGNASAFGSVTGITVDGGVLDLNGFDLTTPALDGAGGEIALGAGTLTVNNTTANAFAGEISGPGGLTKSGAGRLTLTGTSTYTGNTTIGGGELRLDFSAPGAPTGNILSASTALNMAGGVLSLTGADGAANTQSFGSLDVAAGNNRITASSGTGGSLDVDLGAITRTSGLVDFGLPDSGVFTTANPDGALGGWATINGSDYAKVVGGSVVAFDDTDYTDKDEAATWIDGEFISDDDGDADGFSGTVTGSVQLGGLRYSMDVATTVTVDPGEVLGVDGAIIVAPSVGENDQLITGGSLTGGVGGGALGVLQNSAGNFTIASTIVDNGGATGFTKGGPGAVTLAGANTYTGVTTLASGTLAVSDIGNGGVASNIGASSADASNLVLQGGVLQYTGGTAASDRGFTLVNGAATAPAIEVTNPGANLTFAGLVTSPDDAGLTKTGGGILTLANDGNDYVGTTTISGGRLSVDAIADGGVVSGIGAASSDAENLVMSGGGMLQYTGATTASNRGFTLDAGGGGIDISDPAAALTMSGTAVGAGSLTKDGAGTLILSGINTYTGGTVVEDGILRAGSTGAFGAVTSLMTVQAGGVLDLDGFNSQVGALAGDGDVTLGSAVFTLNGANGTFSGTISGPGSLAKSGGGLQVMSGCNNDYQGVTTINGTLSVDCLADGDLASGVGASGSDSSNLVLIGGRLTYTGASVSTDRGFTLQSSNNFINVDDAGTTLEFGGIAAGGGNLQKEGNGVLLLSGANTYTGVTVARAGILRAGSAGAFGNTSSLQTLNVAGATIDLNDFDTAAGFIHGGGALGGEIALGSATLTLTAGSNGSNFAGVISGSGGIVKNGGANQLQTITGCNNSYGGSTVINGGILSVSCLEDGGINSTIGASNGDADMLVLNGGTLRYSGAGSSTDRLFTLGGNFALEASGSGTVTFSNAASITHAGTGDRTLTLGGTNTGNNTFAAGIDNPAGGATSLTKTGAGTWILTNPDSTYTGVTTITGGVLGVDNLADGGVASSIGMSSNDPGNLVIGAGGTLRYTGTGDTTDRRFTLAAGTTAIQSSGSGAIEFTNTGAISYSGNGTRVISLGGTNADDNLMGAGIGNQSAVNITSLAKNDTGRWILTGNNTYTGSTNVNAGTLVLGNGGTTGSIVSNLSNVAAGSLLGFNRSDEYSYGGTIQGAGSIEQLGNGLTVLTGANTYTGSTTVSAGSLWIDGDQSAATGLTTVHSGATLGGTGTIGGNVAIANGGTLAPGNSPGTLTINGDLSLDNGSVLDYEFGQSDVVGGPLNDLIEVGGDLVLDGTINVAVSSGGSFDAGLYRVINYGGTLTDNGLVTGTIPAGSSVLVQTAMPGQVNLINTAGLEVNLWDGDAGPKADGAVDGGDGTWQASAGNDNWTSESGMVNLPYTDDAFAIFTATPGTVTVDNGVGAVSASGMQFASDGYVITGDALELAAPQSIIRVGDGTAAGLDYSATVASQLTGATELVKTDLGTLVLSGANSYSGGTRIESGVLRIAGDASLGDVAGGLTFGGGKLHTTSSFGSARAIVLEGDGAFEIDPGTALTLSGVVSGAASLIKEGAGTLVLTANNSYDGGTSIAGGALRIGDGGTNGSIGGDVENDGALVFDRSDALTFTGMISGAGSLTQAGSGTLILTGDNGYTGLTTVSSGTLQLGDGGAAGSIAGDVVNDGVLSFNRSDTLSFAGIVSGTGALAHDGDGITVLTGDNSYGGATTVNAGALVIDGDQSAATAATGVASGAAIGGAGIIGGDLSIADGGTLAPGSMGVGTLTVMGDLFLAGGSRLDYEFGESDVVGGPLNDLLEVGDGLVLDGTIDVTVSPGGSFDVGLYRIASYAGALTDNGLETGTLPAGSDVAVQTSIANQVNLVNTAGLTLGFWDGDAGPKFDGAVDGGDGQWQAGGNDNWTETDGTINAAYANGTFAIFSAAAGTVTVDDSLGAVTAAGMQFASDGYVVTGDAVELAGTESIIRVGDGTAAGAGMTATISSALTGSGALVKTDLGSLILTGTNDYAGGTTIEAGTLLFNGDQSGATGLVNVLSGGTVGGSGTVGGDMTIADGGTLAPGDGPGTLTIVGDLLLSSGSMLAFELGEADVVGGTLNDLVTVGGDLTLDGTLNVTVPAGGAFDAGVYRLFDYGGELTDNGLELGSLPAGSSAFVQTAVANQVSLVNVAGAALNFWDGAAGSANDGQVEGGDGVWRLSGDDWTSATGMLNGPYLNGAMAVFMGAPGTVTIDNSDGAVLASGLQFAVDGYVLEGETLTLTGGPTLIRVGDGTDAGGDMTATIGSVLAGDSMLEKSDLGRLVLAGDNTYTGGTTVREGVLQLGDGGTSGSIIGNVANDGTLVFNRSDVFTFDGQITGSGALEQIGSGTTILTGAHAFTGGTTISAGALQVDGTLIGVTTIADGATLSGIGTVESVTALAGGFVSPGNEVTPFGALTLTGDYSGTGTVIINSALGDETSATSRLVIEGSTTDASSPVLVNNVGGNGAQTAGDGIGIIQVDGTSPAGSFHLAEPVQAGAYEYLLYQGGEADVNDWFLRSELMDPTGTVEPPAPVPSWRPGVAGYALGPQLSLEYGFTALGNLRLRVGDQGRVLDPADRAPADAWMRVYTHSLDITGNRFKAEDLRMTTVQFGTDILHVDTGSGSAHFGVMASVGESSATFFDPERAIGSLATRAGDVEMDVVGGGLYWTRYGGSGAYLDVSAQLLNYRNRYRDQYSAVGRQDGWGGTLAAEVGAPLALGTRWYVEPQLHLAWQRLELDGFTDAVSAVSDVSDDGLRGRASLQLFRMPSDWLGMSDASPYLGVGVQRDFRDAGSVTIGATAVHEDLPETTADLSLGFTGSVRDGVELHFDVRYQQSTDGKRDGLRGNLGFRVRF